MMPVTPPDPTPTPDLGAAREAWDRAGVWLCECDHGAGLQCETQVMWESGNAYIDALIAALAQRDAQIERYRQRLQHAVCLDVASSGKEPHDA